jgi:hypothetical protein
MPPKHLLIFANSLFKGSGSVFLKRLVRVRTPAGGIQAVKGILYFSTNTGRFLRPT